jgi:hypothetical protein
MKHLDVNYIPDQVLTFILNNKGLDDGDEESYSKVEGLTVREAFNSYLEWRGFFGYTDSIIEALDGLREAEKQQSLSQTNE